MNSDIYRYDQETGSWIAKDFKHGENFRIGFNCVIQQGCQVGDDVTMEHFVLLKSGTIIGNNVYVDSYFKSSGNNKIGSNVTLRFNSTVAREVTIEDDVFLAPNVMTEYSDHQGEKHPGTVIGKGSFIGSNAVISAGVRIAPGCVVGALSYVKGDLAERGVYVGTPAKLVRNL